MISNRKQIRTTNVIVITVVILSALCILFGMSGCALKILPIRNTDAQVEMLRRVAIESYKDGVFDGFMSTEPIEGKELFGLDEPKWRM